MLAIFTTLYSTSHLLAPLLVASSDGYRYHRACGALSRECRRGIGRRCFRHTFSIFDIVPKGVLDNAWRFCSRLPNVKHWESHIPLKDIVGLYGVQDALWSGASRRFVFQKQWISVLKKEDRCVRKEKIRCCGPMISKPLVILSWPGWPISNYNYYGVEDVRRRRTIQRWWWFPSKLPEHHFLEYSSAWRPVAFSPWRVPT